MSLRLKLLLVSLVLLAIPFVGYTYVTELERLLNAAQEQALASTARAVSNVLNERGELLRAPVLVPTNDGPPAALPEGAAVDGDAAEWEGIDAGHYARREVITRGPEGQAPDVAFTLRLARFGPRLWGLADVRDRDTLARDNDALSPDGADHLLLVGEAVNGERGEFAIVLRKGGRAAFLQRTAEGWQLADPRAQAAWRERSFGYVVEFALPITPVAEALTLTVVDVGTATGPLAGAVSTGAMRFTPSAPIVRDARAELAALIRGVERAQTRLTVVDANARVLARAGGLSLPAGEVRNIATPLDRLETSVLKPLYDWLIPPPALDVRETELNPDKLEQGAVQSALEGIVRAERRAALGTSGQRVEILAAAYPIWQGERIVGAVVAEETTAGVQQAKKRALERLILATAAAFALATLALLWLATRLSGRVIRLAQEAERAIDANGRIDRALVTQLARRRDRDEIGDLARGFSGVLGRLADYQAHLERMRAILSHELRTPMAVVRSSLDNLQLGALDADASVYVTRAQEGLARLDKLVTAIGESARLEQALQSAERESFDLARVVASCVEGYRGVHGAARFALELPAAPVMIEGAPELIAQALDKLVANALDFARGDAPIEIALTANARHARLIVRNVGPALPAGAAAQLFDSMVSMRDASDTGKTPHLGLGLYIVRLIAEFHGGEAQARNRGDGNGVEVDMTLPRQG